MDIYPQHLRERYHAAIIYQRSGNFANSWLTLESQPARINNVPALRRSRMSRFWMRSLGRINLYWARGLGLTDAQAAVGVSCVSLSPVINTAFLFSAPLALVLIFSIISTNTSSGIFAVAMWIACGAITSLEIAPRRALHRIYRKPLALSDFAQIEASVKDDLNRAYLALICTVVQQQVPANAAPELRTALQTLGQSLDTLPRVMAAAKHNPHPIRQEAAALRKQATDENDTVIARSLERRAEALDRQAAAQENLLLLIRRTEALHAELRSQIEALQTGLIFFDAGVVDTATLTILSEQAQQVAMEATAVTQAQAEMDSSLGFPMPQPQQSFAMRSLLSRG